MEVKYDDCACIFAAAALAAFSKRRDVPVTFARNIARHAENVFSSQFIHLSQEPWGMSKKQTLASISVGTGPASTQQLCDRFAPLSAAPSLGVRTAGRCGRFAPKRQVRQHPRHLAQGFGLLKSRLSVPDDSKRKHSCGLALAKWRQRIPQQARKLRKPSQAKHGSTHRQN